jgi:hypothetical protein
VGQNFFSNRSTARSSKSTQKSMHSLNRTLLLNKKHQRNSQSYKNQASQNWICAYRRVGTRGRTYAHLRAFRAAYSYARIQPASGRMGFAGDWIPSSLAMLFRSFRLVKCSRLGLSVSIFHVVGVPACLC